MPSLHIIRIKEAVRLKSIKPFKIKLWINIRVNYLLKKKGILITMDIKIKICSHYRIFFSQNN